ncbi:DUF2207 domain-containing protein [Paenibacillus sp. AR247]|uniref:DUF2207 domain-containing protein n=1 Tax=Paenibacillus sp. AR247 TaxID=1631599 RepID=UPI000CF850CE|nr:DUF2207 domain-containing protein [Paenibacillus sp. AR247]PQP87512.1 hypothetical protein CPT76_21530 [Paenibacillus sp. AR247]
MRRWWLLLGSLVLVLGITGCGDKKSYSMDRVESRAYLGPDGDLYVEELFTYTFKGSFNGMTRAIDRADQKGVEFFEAYVPPEHPKLGSFSYENLQRLDVQWDDDNDTYYIYDAAQNETKQVYYRYRIDHAAVRYGETGKLEWSFFKNNQEDLHQVSVDLFMPGDYKDGDVHAYLHDRSGGKITSEGPPAVHYETDDLKSDGTAHMVVYFPPDQLSQMTASEEQLSLQKQLSAEQKYQDRLAARDVRMNAIRPVVQVGMAVFIVGALLYALSWRKISAWLRRGDVTRQDIDEADPLLLMYMLRKGRLKREDFMAGLLSLRQKGYVTVKQVPASKRFQEEPTAPEFTLLFTFTGRMDQLNPAEKHLVGWLFEEINGSLIFKLDSLAGPTFKERQSARIVKQYRAKSVKHADRLMKWIRLLSRTQPYSGQVRPNPLLKLFIPLTAAVNYGLLLYLLYTDAASTLMIVLTAVLLGAGGVWASIRFRNKLWIFLYLLTCFIMGSQIVHDISGDYLILTVCSALFVWSIPVHVLSWETHRYRYALKALRSTLGKGEMSYAGEPLETEQAAEYAALLGTVPRYIKHRKQPGTSGAALAAAVPALFSVEIMESLNYTQNHLLLKPMGVGGSSSSSSSSFSDGGGGGGGGGTGAF